MLTRRITILKSGDKCYLFGNVDSTWLRAVQSSLIALANRNMTVLNYQMQYLPFQLILKKALRRRGKEHLLRPKEVENETNISLKGNLMISMKCWRDIIALTHFHIKKLTYIISIECGSLNRVTP